MKLLAHLVELNEDRKYMMADTALEALDSKAKNIMTDAMGLAHSIGCTIWCDAKRDHVNYQLISSKGAVIDQTR